MVKTVSAYRHHRNVLHRKNRHYCSLSKRESRWSDSERYHEQEERKSQSPSGEQEQHLLTMQTEYKNEKLNIMRASIENALRFMHFIDYLQDEMQMSARSMALQLEWVDFSALIQEQIEHVQSATRECTIHFEEETSLAQLIGDAYKLKQVVNALLLDAVKYSSRRGPILVSACAEGDSIHLRVQGQSIGISPEALAEIFMTHNEFHAEAIHSSKEAELGLPMVRQIVQLHGGKVWADVTPEHGITFHVFLPLTPIASI